MNLSKKILLIIFAACIIKSALARQQQSVVTLPALDSMAIKDTGIIAQDLKKGFKNLFISSSLGGVSGKQQLNPQAFSFMQDYMRRHEKNLKRMKDWGRPYFDMMDVVLTQHGIPKELKYLAVIESHLKASAVSWAGAVGPWQFMPATARRYGLRVSHQYDERTDYIKSTHAASRMLKDLYAIYGDWLLVIAAYNGGPGNVDKAIRRTGSKDFWTLQHKLPNESKDHVKKFISTHYIMEGEGGVTTLTKAEAKNAVVNMPGNLSKEEMDSSRVLEIGGRYNDGVIAKHLEMTIAEFNRYNPNFNTRSSTDGKYMLRLPSNKMEIFLTKRYLILEESMQYLLNR